MPMNPDLYPADWDDIAERTKSQADWTCEKCGRRCYRPGEASPDRRYVLTTAHINHTPADCRPENLVALCSACHIRYDASYKALKRRKARLLALYAARRHRQKALELDT